MPDRDQLAAQVSRELRAAVAAQRRRSYIAEIEPHIAANPERQQLRSKGTISRWLYPISGRGGYSWELTDENWESVTLESSERLTKSGRLKNDPWWELTTNYRRIQAGDFVYIYTGNDDAGIVGFAVANQIRTPEQGRPEVCLSIDFRLSRRLVQERPVPATVIRQWLRPQKRAVENLTAFSRDLDRMLSRLPGYTKHLRQARSPR